jgi:hypothetical protein
MSADALLEFFSSNFYRSILSLLVSMSLAVIACLVYFAFTKRSKKYLEVDLGHAPWNLLMATMLDSFLITLLYTAENIAYAASNFSREAATFADSPFALVPYLSSVFGLFMQFAIAWIAIWRVIALRQWLSRKEDAAK